MSKRLPERLVERLPHRYRRRVPPEIPALWEHPERFSALTASTVAMFALAIFPPFLSPGAMAIQAELKRDPTNLGLVALAGIALGAGTLLFGGALGDVDGHRRWLLIGLAGLVGSSLFGILFQGDEGLLMAGLLGTFWSGFALPLGIAVVADAYPDRTVKDIGIGLGFAALGAAQIVAPVTQDILHDLFGVWAIYLLPIATGALAFRLVLRNVPERIIPPDLRRRDVLGQALTAAVPLTIATFLIVLLPGEVDVMAIAGLIGLATVGVIAALLRRQRGKGVLPAGAGPGRVIMVALFVGVFMSFALNAPLLYFGSFLRVIRDWGEWFAAAALIPHLVPLLLGGIYAPVLTHRYGYVRVIVLSLVILAVSTAGFALASADTGYLWFVLPLAMLGLGLIFGATARTGLILSRMPRALPGLANALNLASMELGAILGQTVMTVMLMRLASDRYADLLAAAGIDEAVAGDAVSDFREALGSVAPGGTTGIAPAQDEGLLPGFRQAMTEGLSLSLWIVTLATIIATIVTIVLFRWAKGDEADTSGSVPGPPEGTQVEEPRAPGLGGEEVLQATQQHLGADGGQQQPTDADQQ